MAVMNELERGFTLTRVLDAPPGDGLPGVDRPCVSAVVL
jgi:hypothetical protein